MIDLEYLYSARSSDEYELWLADRRGGYESIPLTPAVGDRALDVQRAFARLSQHRGASLPDLLIAACAEAREATVLHYDSDYELIAGVTAQSVEWVVPRGSVP